MSNNDNHHAAASGVKAETYMKKLFQKHGIKLYRLNKEFEKDNIDPMGKKYLKKPKDYPELLKFTRHKKDESFYESDGYVNQDSGYIIELKNSTKHGTTEEKVIYDLEKIRDGVYNKDGHQLIYAFTGPKCEETGVYKLFALKAKRENLPVKVIFGWSELENFIIQLKGGVNE